MTSAGASASNGRGSKERCIVMQNLKVQKVLTDPNRMKCLMGDHEKLRSDPKK